MDGCCPCKRPGRLHQDDAAHEHSTQPQRTKRSPRAQGTGDEGAQATHRLEGADAAQGAAPMREATLRTLLATH